jgi:hypothetical protein
MQVFKNKGKDQDVSKTELEVNDLCITTLFVATSPESCRSRNIALETTQFGGTSSDWPQSPYTRDCPPLIIIFIFAQICFPYKISEIQDL